MAYANVCVDCDPKEQQSIVSTGVETNSQIVPHPKHDPLDASTFVHPPPSVTPGITIEFCNRCRWLHRANWVSTELMLTFPTPTIKAVTVIPLDSEETGGRFRVWLYQPSDNAATPAVKLVWDRKIEGGFPELKELKQRIRDHVQPGKSLGHSDKK